MCPSLRSSSWADRRVPLFNRGKQQGNILLLPGTFATSLCDHFEARQPKRYVMAPPKISRLVFPPKNPANPRVSPFRTGEIPPVLRPTIRLFLACFPPVIGARIRLVFKPARVCKPRPDRRQWQSTPPPDPGWAGSTNIDTVYPKLEILSTQLVFRKDGSLPWSGRASGIYRA